MTGKPFLQQQPRRSYSVIVVMTTRDCLCKLGEVVDDDQDAGVVVVRGADLQVVVLDQFIEVPALDVFQMESDVTRLIMCGVLEFGPPLWKCPGVPWRRARGTRSRVDTIEA